VSARALAVLILVALAVTPGEAVAAGALTAGAATVVFRVPPGTPLGGYGSVRRRLLLPDVLGRHPHAFWFKPHEGELDPVAARAVVLETRAARLAWVTVDLVAVDRAFTRDVERRLAQAGVAPFTLLVSASHTHSGPGAFIESALIGWVAMDRADGEVRDALLGAVVSAIRRADAARVDALAAAAAVPAPAVTASRLGLPLDPEIVAVRLTSVAGAPIALVWNFAIHGTMLGARNLRLSGDVMGEASRTLERELGAPVLFVNGAVADVSPARHGEGALADVGRELAAAVRGAWRAAARVRGAELVVRRSRVSLPSPRLAVRNCLGRWVPRFVTLPLGSALPADAELIAVALGDTAWVTIPGELQTAFGLEIKRAAQTLFAHAFVAGVSNDYLGYFVTPADYDRPAYVTCATVYGPYAGECLASTAADLLYRLRGRSRPVSGRPAPCDFTDRR
jgi:neutral ceramidase